VREESRSMHVHWFVKIGEREEEIRCMVSWPAISHVPRKRASQNSLMECDGRGADYGVLQDGLETIRESVRSSWPDQEFGKVSGCKNLTSLTSHLAAARSGNVHAKK
jgi:hypothetical protein